MRLDGGHGAGKFRVTETEGDRCQRKFQTLVHSETTDCKQSYFPQAGAKRGGGNGPGEQKDKSREDPR